LLSRPRETRRIKDDAVIFAAIRGHFVEQLKTILGDKLMAIRWQVIEGYVLVGGLSEALTDIDAHDLAGATFEGIE
jgi:hypothetical protein